MITFPNAKINLGLSVTAKRTDGFHEVETLMMPVEWQDILEMVRAEGERTELQVSGLSIDGDRKKNLVWQAWEIMQQKFSLPPVHIHLHKVIPSGAGLGGGSSDAAGLVRLCNDEFALNLDDDELEDLVRPLGSDCAFFIRNRPVLATGKGDQLEPITMNLPPLHIILVKPPVHIPTAEAYSWITPGKKAEPLAEIIQRPPEDWKAHLVNDFEAPVFKFHPGIRSIRDHLYQKGAVYASLTGSGSAVYGLFKNRVDLKADYPNTLYWQGKLEN